MKSLTAQWLHTIVGIVAFTLIHSHVIAQCTVSAGADISKCYGAIATLGANVTATGQSPYQYSWNGGSSWSGSPTYNVTALASGTYTVMVQDANGCTSSDQIVLTVLPAPLADAGADVNICPGTPVQLCGTSSSSNGAIIAQLWLPGGTSGQCINVAPMSTTTYTYTVTDAANCQASNTVQVTTYANVAVNAGTDQTLCLSVGSQQLTATPTGGTWSGTGVNATGLFTATTTGTFTLTYTKVTAQGCSFSDSMVMTVINPSPPSGGVDHVVCLNTPSFQLPAVGTWSGSALVTPSGIFTPSSVGINNLTVSNTSGGCTVIDNVQVTVLALPIVNAGTDQSICSGSSAQLNGTASSANGSITNVAWGGSWVSNSNILNPTAAPPATTTYILYVTDNQNCTASDDVIINVNAYPIVNAGNDITICSNASPTQLNGNTPSEGTWSGDGVNSSGLFTPSTIGTYTITYLYTSVQGCTASDTRVVQVIAPDTINAGSDQSVCLNTLPIQLLSGGTWSGSPLVTAGGLFTPSTAGSYTLTYSTLSGLCTSTDQLVVTVKPLPSVNAGNDQSICSGQNATLNGSANSVNGVITTYAWSGGSVANSAAPITTASPTINTTYTLLATDASSCSASDNITVTVNSLPPTDAGNDIILCSNVAPTQLSGFSPAGGTWSGSGVNATGLFTPIVAGNFTLSYSYSNAQGCTASDSRVVNVIAPDIINAGSDQNICLNSAPIQLLSGGTWSGSPLVTSAGLFTPSAVGNYTLTYSTVSGLCNSSDQIVISVKALPTVNAGNDQSICNGQTANLNGSASSVNGSISTYAWSGGTVANAANATTTTSPSGTTIYSLQVTDALGCSASDQSTVTVNGLPAVNAGNDITLCNQPIAHQLTGFTPAGGTWSGAYVTSVGVFTPNGIGTFNLTYSFTNANNCTASDDLTINVTATSYADAGADEAVCFGASAFSLTTITSGGVWISTPNLTTTGVFTPNTVGTFICTYSEGSGTCMTSDTKTVTVHSLPMVNAGNDASICAGNSHSIDATVNGGAMPYNYLWSNAATLSDNDQQDVVATPSITTAYTLNVTDANNCTTSDNTTVNVVALATASFDVSDTACTNSVVAFINNSSGASSYNWSLGNGNNSMTTNPTNIYVIDGTYNVTLSAYNSIGCESTTNGNIHIISPPDAHFSLSSSEGCSPLLTSFINQSVGEAISMTWDLAGNISFETTPDPLEFATEIMSAEYDIVLTVENICGTDTHAEVVVVNPQPVADFSTTLSSQCSPVTTHFINNSAGNPDSYLWDLGNGEITPAFEPTDEVYTTEENSADFTVKLFAFNTCGVDSIESIVTVLPNTVEMNLMPTVNLGCSPLFVEFNNATTGATNYYFDFDDGNNSSLISPNHIFENAGSFDVIYYADDGCSYDTTVITIEVLQSPAIEITSNSIATCPDQSVTFFATTVGDIQSITWDFGDGNTAIGEQVDNVYSAGNDYFVSAYAQESNGCNASASMPYTVHPKPHAMMSAAPSLACSPMMVCTTNTTTDSVNQNWNFGNGATSTNVNDCSEYINTTDSPIDYSVALYVINEFLCTDSTFQIVTVQPQPVTDFELSSTSSCFPLEVITSINNTAGGTNYEWFVNGSSNSTDPTPTFTFVEVGIHSIELVASNDYGCTDTHSDTYTIHPKPFIDIVPSPQNGCAPLEVNFTNNTANGETYSWTFSNGEQSILETPQITFEDEGWYDVQVFATSIYGCESVQFFDDMIQVYGLPVAGFSFSPNEEIIYELDIAFADSSSGTIEYQWDFGDGFESTEPEPVHHYETGGTFYVTQTVVNEFGCTDAQTQTVNIDNTYYIYIPNSFTPDNDGINDVFIPTMSDTQHIRQYEFLVMNRWGEVVFKTDNPEMGWTGNVREGQYYTHNDCFTYSIKISFNNNTVNQQHAGNVTVLR